MSKSEVSPGGGSALWAWLRTRFTPPPGESLHLPQARATPDHHHIPSLNGLRAASVLIVLVAHFGLAHIVPGGFGVTVFFFVSGFLISRLVAAEFLETGRVSLGMFYARRFLRLMPALYALIAIVLLVRIIAGQPINPPAISAGLLYYQNYFNLFAEPVDLPLPTGHLWSLAVEEHFYFLFPALMALLLPRKDRSLLLLTGVLVTLPLVLRILNLTVFDRPEEYNYLASETRFDSILWGCLLTLLLMNPSTAAPVRRLFGWTGFACGLAIILTSLVVRDPFFRESFRYSLQGGGLFLVVGALVFGSGLRPLQILANIGVVDWIGRLSYSLYLWHIAVLQALDYASPGLGGAKLFVAALTLSFVCASASYYGIERPLMRLRRRFRPAEETGAALTSPSEFRGRQAP